VPDSPYAVLRGNFDTMISSFFFVFYFRVFVCCRSVQCNLHSPIERNETKDLKFRIDKKLSTPATFLSNPKMTCHNSENLPSFYGLLKTILTSLFRLNGPREAVVGAEQDRERRPRPLFLKTSCNDSSF
jgi:hypothetical protein